MILLKRKVGMGAGAVLASIMLAPAVSAAPFAFADIGDAATVNYNGPIPQSHSGCKHRDRVRSNHR